MKVINPKPDNGQTGAKTPAKRIVEILAWMAVQDRLKKEIARRLEEVETAGGPSPRPVRRHKPPRNADD
jgi:hypothetical protein